MRHCGQKNSRKEEPDKNCKREGFILITAALLSGIMLFSALLVLFEGIHTFNEKTEQACRLRSENALMQASALAAAWLRSEISRSHGAAFFSEDAPPETAPLICLPGNFFSVFEDMYPECVFSCLTADLHYAPSFRPEAARLGIPNIPPRRHEKGASARYFLQKTSVSDKKHSSMTISVTKIISCTKNKNGGIIFRTENETY